MNRPWLYTIFLLLLVSAVSLSITVVSLKHQQRQAHSEFHRLRASNEELLLMQSQLLLESSTLASYKRVQRAAREQLRMRAPEAWEVLWLKSE